MLSPPPPLVQDEVRGDGIEHIIMQATSGTANTTDVANCVDFSCWRQEFDNSVFYLIVTTLRMNARI